MILKDSGTVRYRHDAVPKWIIPLQHWGDMQKIHVSATAGRAYGFLFREFGTILRLSWLPLLLVILVQYSALIVFEPVEPERTKPGASPFAIFAEIIGLIGPGGMLGLFAGIIGTAIVAVALHRVILFGERRHGHFFYLSFGRTEWLFMVVFVVFGLVIVLLFLASMMFSPMLLSLAPPRPARSFLLTMLILLLPILLLFAAVMYLWIRFSLIFPVTVIEGRADLAQVQTITRGHFWRLFGVWLIVMGPVFLASLFLQWLDAFGFGLPGTEMTAEYVDDVPALLRSSVLQFVLTLVSGALSVAVLSYSYKALKGHDLDEVLEPQA
jgi:hypothetical protein